MGGRGRHHEAALRAQILALIDEAVAGGARQSRACAVLGVSTRTLQRWRTPERGKDRRQGPKSPPSNRLTPEERERVLAIARSPEYCDLPPSQIVPRLADEGLYVASESSFYRILREEKELSHRRRSKPPTSRAPSAKKATGPEQVWSWDVSYLRGPILGTFFYLYLFLDVWSRKIVGWSVHTEESSEWAALSFEDACREQGLDPAGLYLHSDNGSPMKGATMLATLTTLGVLASFSRPRVSDDNPFSEALFRTLKYRPAYPTDGFATIEEAREWVAGFVAWYNTEHRHSALKYVTPAQRHAGEEGDLLAHRDAVYRQARSRHPERWSGRTRNWTPVGEVVLNPERSRSPRPEEVTEEAA